MSESMGGFVIPRGNLWSSILATLSVPVILILGHWCLGFRVCSFFFANLFVLFGF